MPNPVEWLLRLLGEFGPLLVILAVVALPAIFRRVQSPPRGRPRPARGPAPAPAPGPGRSTVPADEEDLIADIRRFLDRAGKGARGTESAERAEERVEADRGRHERQGRMAAPVSQAEAPAHPRPQPTAHAEPLPPPLHHPLRPVAEAARPAHRRPSGPRHAPLPPSSAARQARMAPPPPGPAPAAWKAVPWKATLDQDAPSRGQELIQVLLGHPGLAILAAEVFGPCRARVDYGRSATMPTALRDDQF